MLKFKLTRLPRRLYSTSTSCTISNYLNCQIDSFLLNQSLNLNTLLKSHAYIITTGHTNNLFIASKLISLYASLNQPNNSSKIFNSTSFKDPFLWNAIIKAHFGNGNYSQALEFFNSMRFSTTLPNQFTIPMVVSASSELGLVKYGEKIHGLVSKLNLFYGNSAVGSSFVYMYSKFGSMCDASNMFDEISMRDVVAWTALIIGYVQNNENEKALDTLFLMHKIGNDNEKPNFRTLQGGFQACGNLNALVQGKCLHGLSLKYGILYHQTIQSSILSMYSKCGTLKEAHLSFSEVIEKDLLTWTSIIRVYAKMENINECLRIFFEMEASGIYPDGIVLSCVLLGFGNSLRINEGKAFHGFILRKNYEINETVLNGLLSMYCKFGLFNQSIKLYREMQNLGIEVDSNCLISVISSCSKLDTIKLGRSIHCHVIKYHNNKNISISNSLIDMYGKHGNFEVARKIFFNVEKDVITWNILISCYIRSGEYFNALDLFDKMVEEDFKPNNTTLIIVLSACSNIACLEKGEFIHEYVRNEGYESNLTLATALCDMYAKCGKLVKAREIFELIKVKERDVVLWNVMISSYGMHGDVESAIEMWNLMEKGDVAPNEVTFLALLSVCAHVGWVKEGKFLFSKMESYSLRPNIKHYACMVDLLGRSGYLNEAEELICNMPVLPDGEVWGALVTACKVHNEFEMGIRIALKAIESDPENDGYYVMVSDLYSSLGMWEEVEKVRRVMKEREVRKSVGWSKV